MNTTLKVRNRNVTLYQLLTGLISVVWDELQILAEDEPDDDDDVVLMRELREKLKV